MKEFDKWWNKYSMEGMWDYEEYAEAGWEAALEWVANKCRGRRSKGLFDLLDEIDRELSGK